MAARGSALSWWPWNSISPRHKVGVYRVCLNLRILRRWQNAMWQNEMFARHFWVGYKSGGTDVIVPLRKIRLEPPPQKLVGFLFMDLSKGKQPFMFERRSSKNDPFIYFCLFNVFFWRILLWDSSPWKTTIWSGSNIFCIFFQTTEQANPSNQGWYSPSQKNRNNKWTWNLKRNHHCFWGAMFVVGTVGGKTKPTAIWHDLLNTYFYIFRIWNRYLSLSYPA